MGASYRILIDCLNLFTFGIKIYPFKITYLPTQTIPSKKIMISRFFIHFIINFFFSPSLRPNQNPKRKQLQQKRKRKPTLRRRKKPQKKRKIQMRIHLHPRPRKRGVDPQLKKPPLKRNLHLKRSPNLKNASAHLSLQKVRAQKAATLAKKKSKVVTLNHPKGSTKPRKLAVEGFVGLQQKNGKGADQIPRGRMTVVLLQVRIQTCVES